MIWKEIRIPAILLVFTLFGGALGFKFFYPEEPWYRLFYFTAITLSTVGYGDILKVEDDPLAVLYTISLIFLGMGMVLYSASSITAFIIEGRLGELFKRRRIMRKISKMEDHFIVCGAGETGHHVIREIIESGKDLVVIDTANERAERLEKEFPGLAIIDGDATSDEVLNEANISNAKGLIAALKNDKDNLFLTFTAKMLNPNIIIVAKLEFLNMMKKMRNAGADYVVSPQFIGGMRIASVVLRPNVVSFLDRMLKGKDRSVRVSEYVIPANSKFVGSSFKDAKIKEKTGVDVFAYCPAQSTDEYRYNPEPELELEAGGVLLFICNNEQQSKVENYFT